MLQISPWPVTEVHSALAGRAHYRTQNVGGRRSENAQADAHRGVARDFESGWTAFHRSSLSASRLRGIGEMVVRLQDILTGYGIH